MLTAIIIDDELKGRSALRQKLKDYCPGVALVAEAASGPEGVKLIEKHHPNIVFLDIHMPRMSGFEMLHHITHKDFHLVFTTAYDQYAIKAIKYAAFDYLLKPIDIEELQTTIARAENQLTLNNTKERLETLEQNLKSLHSQHKIGIPTMDGIIFFNLTDIVYLEAQSNYTTIHFIDHPKLLASRTLGTFAELLPSEMFFRPHHSFVINLHFVKRYIKGDGGRIEMQNGHYVDVARRKKEEFLALMR